ncbi:hypothetical protein O6H91_Y160100 [Diphasiastrum complanatum]|nr:hypothetical protein O6H91_Y160100 [Diphasiastrum complanatum]
MQQQQGQSQGQGQGPRPGSAAICSRRSSSSSSAIIFAILVIIICTCLVSPVCSAVDAFPIISLLQQRRDPGQKSEPIYSFQPASLQAYGGFGSGNVLSGPSQLSVPVTQRGYLDGSQQQGPSLSASDLHLKAQAIEQQLHGKLKAQAYLQEAYHVAQQRIQVQQANIQAQQAKIQAPQAQQAQQVSLQVQQAQQAKQVGLQVQQPQQSQHVGLQVQQAQQLNIHSQTGGAWCPTTGCSDPTSFTGSSNCSSSSTGSGQFSGATSKINPTASHCSGSNTGSGNFQAQQAKSIPTASHCSGSD